MRVVPFPTVRRSTLRELSVTTFGGEGFNYAALDSNTADQLKKAAQEIRTCQHSAGLSIVEIGVKLIRVKASLDHGQFGSWLREEFGWSERTAQNCMRVAEVFQAKSETVADLPASLIYKLAAPSTPIEIREKVIAGLEEGRLIDCVEVTKEIERCRPSHLLKKLERIEKATQEGKAILAKLPAADQDRLFRLLEIPGVAHRLCDGRERRRKPQ